MRIPSVGVHQVMATLGYGDAIGNEALGMRQVLQDAGYDSRIFVEDADRRLEDQTDDYRDLIDSGRPDDILIHHFSIGSKASRISFAVPGRMILVYHNITPPAHFIGVNPRLVQLCWSGHRELRAYATRADLALGDSEFNRRELEAAGFSRTDVLPVVPSFAHLEVAPNPIMADEFDEERTNILFVGRMIPNKRIDDLIRFFQTYRLRYDRRARLILVGSQSGFEDYVASLFDLIATRHVPDVHLVGHVSNAELTAYYSIADLFLSASEHEGFCVPLVEAFYKRIPVIAFAAGAVPDTMDGGGVLYDWKDARHVASLINTVLTDEALQEEIVRGQDEALARLREKKFGEMLLRFVERVRESPRLTPPRVAPDVADRLEAWRALEEIREYRPSAYQALPRRRSQEDTGG